MKTQLAPFARKSLTLPQMRLSKTARGLRSAPRHRCVLNVVPFGVDHPQVPRLGKALARAGFVVLLYWSPAMHDFRLDPEDTENIVLAYRWFLEQSSVDPARSGLLGTCVGGSFALMAAASLLIRDRIGFIGPTLPIPRCRRSRVTSPVPRVPAEMGGNYERSIR